MFQDMSQNISLFLIFFQPFKNEKKLSHYKLYKNRGQGLVPWPRFADPWFKAMRLALWINTVHWAVMKNWIKFLRSHPGLTFCYLFDSEQVSASQYFTVLTTEMIVLKYMKIKFSSCNKFCFITDQN